MTPTSSSLLLDAVLDANNHLQLRFTREMHPILSESSCRVSSESADDATVTVRSEAAKSNEVGFCSTGSPCTPLPHFHEETCAYIRGHFWVVGQLPSAKAKALKMARRTASRAVPLEQKDASSPESQGQFLSQLRKQRHGVQQRMLQALKTPYRRTTGSNEARLSPAVRRRSFLAMAQHEIHQDTTSSTSSNNDTPKPSSTNIGLAVTTSARYPVYDGLRSSPPITRAGPHTFKPYTGPFFSPPPSSSEPEDGSKHWYVAEQPSPQPSPPPEDGSEYSYTAGQPSPLLQYATIGRRAIATVIDHNARPIPIPPRTSSLNRASTPRHSLRLSTAGRRPISSFPPLPPLPSPIASPSPEPTSNPSPSPSPSPPHTPNNNHYHHHNHHRPPSPSTSPFPPLHHYTTPAALGHLTAIKAHLELLTTGPSSLTPAELLASLLFRWPETRRGFRASHPGLANLVDETIDWVGVEGEFAEGEEGDGEGEGEGGEKSFVRRWERRLVEEWLWEGGGRVFGGWEWEVAVGCWEEGLLEEDEE